CYVIAGATHPDLLRREGEAYRESLVQRVSDLGIGDNVRFHDRFMGRTELLRWLEAADVFVTPYPNMEQIVSGTLAYAMGAGRAIISTPYAYAAELLAGGHGLLVPAHAPEAWASAIIGLLDNDAHRAKLGSKAYQKSRGMVWSRVAEQYSALLNRVATPGASPPALLPLAAVSA
ncbi:MAG: glycosyltransferase, partial [Chloroflexota bacterium]